MLVGVYELGRLAGGVRLALTSALVCGTSVLFLKWTREAELRQQLVDSGHDPAVAGRAARYGRSALARRPRA